MEDKMTQTVIDVTPSAHVRGWLTRKERLKQRDAASKIQAVWKGHMGRKMKKLKKDMEKIKSPKTVPEIIRALKHLENATSVSRFCSERMLKAVDDIYKLIRSCNRSVPHQEIIHLAVSILCNITKYNTVQTMFTQYDESIDVLVDLLNIYIKHEEIFQKSVEVLRRMCMDSYCKTAVLTKKKEKIIKIYSMVESKKIHNQSKKYKATYKALTDIVKILGIK